MQYTWLRCVGAQCDVRAALSLSTPSLLINVQIRIMNPGAMLLALDLDDTLLDADKRVSPTNLAALECWLTAGHAIVVATGRPPRSVAPVLPPLLQSAPRIVYNGAQAIVDGQVVYANPLPAAAVRQMLTWTAQSDKEWWIGLEIEDQLYVNRHFAKPDPFVVADLQELWAQPVSKMIFFFPNGRGDIDPLLAAVPAGARALVTPKFSIVQLCASTANKAEALRHLLRPRGLNMDDVIAIGDDINDVEMVRASGIGVAVENALPEVKAVADWIAPHHDADGVAHTIYRLLVQNQTMSPARRKPIGWTDSSYGVPGTLSAETFG
jgi:Cof subfamily protein (haloacid dehalogenase superfamily)